MFVARSFTEALGQSMGQLSRPLWTSTNLSYDTGRFCYLIEWSNPGLLVLYHGRSPCHDGIEMALHEEGKRKKSVVAVGDSEKPTPLLSVRTSSCTLTTHPAAVKPNS